jgi:hypothetical protein
VRIILGIVAGLVVMGLVVGGMEVAGHVLFGAPSQRTGLMVMVLVAYFLGAFVGGTVAARITRVRWAAWLVAAAVLVGSLWSMTVISHPGWLMIAAGIAPLLGGLAAARLAPAADARPGGANAHT